MERSEEEYEHLLRTSKEFYETGLTQLEKGFYGLAAFSFEQSLQLFLKGLLFRFGVDFPRTHSIRRLLKFLAEVYPQATGAIDTLLNRYSVELASLEDAYIVSRYIPREYIDDEVLKLKKAVDEVMEIVTRITG